MAEELKVVPKVWGKEIWIANNDKYCGKLLIINPGYRASLHYHKTKMETFYCLEGRCFLQVEGDTTELYPLIPPITIQPGQKHLFYSDRGATIMEVSTHHDDNDVVRITPSGSIK